MNTIETTFTHTEVTPEILTLFVQHKLSASAINVYSYMALHYNADIGNTEGLRIEKIADVLGISQRSVCNAITKLTEAGLFVPVRGQILVSMSYRGCNLWITLGGSFRAGIG